RRPSSSRTKGFSSRLLNKASRQTSETITMKAFLLTIAMLVLFAGVFVPKASAWHHHHRHYDRVVVVERPYHYGYYRPVYYGDRYYDDCYYDRPYYRSYYHRHYYSRPRFSFAFGF